MTETEIQDDSLKLLMVSDLEGCASLGGTQSTFMCSDSFFQKLREKMENNKLLKIAFLGDYFDQGMMVYNSVSNIMKLKKDYSDRVIIILGNRDVNKLRFSFELKNKLKKPENGWSAWTNNKFYSSIENDTDLISKIKLILSVSMNANNKIKNENNKEFYIGLQSFLPNTSKNVYDETAALEYLMDSLKIDDEMKHTDALDLLSFFEMAEILHYDEDTKTLLSHAGGWRRGAFFSKNYIDSLLNSIGDETVNGDNYFTIMEGFRKKLSENNSDSDKLAKSPDECVSAYNDFLQDVLKEIKEKKFTHKFALLQAMSLKPDGEESMFNSVIQSCNLNGCQGFNMNDGNIQTSNFVDENMFSEEETGNGKKIKFISHGHKPFCFYVPLIYKRNDIIFISNDTSNGFRKTSDIDNDLALVTCIGSDADGTLFSSVYPIANNEAGVNKLNEIRGTVGFMFQKFNHKKSPVLYKKMLKYGNGNELHFNVTGYEPLIFKSTSKQSKEGGKNRRTNKRNYKKKTSKRGRMRLHNISKRGKRRSTCCKH